MKQNRTKFMTQAALIAALYASLTMISAPISFGPIQFRISEALAILPYFTPAAVPGLGIGCFLANLLVGGHWLDVVFGTLATATGAFFSYKLRAHPALVPLPPIISNTLIIPWVLRFAYGSKEMILFMVASIGISEIIAIGLLGSLLLVALKKVGAQKLFD